MEKFKKYERYKDSGVPWLGEVPEHWEIKPGHAIYKEKQLKNIGLIEKQVLSLSYGRIIIKSEDKLRGLVPESFETYQIVSPGDIIIRSTDMQNDHTSLRTGIVKDKGIITSAYICLNSLQAESSIFNHWQLHGLDLMKVFYGLGSGLRQNLSWGDFKRLPLPTPPIPEQQQIARYLDWQTSRINKFIRNKKKLIALLKEQKQNIINEAVTKGINPNVKMKDSGVEWLGKIPEHWEVRYVKQLSKILRGKFNFRPRNDPSLYDGKYPFIQTGDVARAGKYITNYKQTLNENGFLISKKFPKGTLTMTIAANIGEVAILDFEACFPDSIVGFVPKEFIKVDFMYYLFLAMKSELKKEAPVNTQGNLNIERIGVMKCALPSIPEQEEILFYLENELLLMHKTISRAEKEITLIQEYRTRLISDVVTGKVDARCIQIPDYEQVELDADISGEEENEEMVGVERDED